MAKFKFDALDTYGGWEEVENELFSTVDPDGFEKVDRAKVVVKEQDWGTSTSICFFLKSGGTKYVALSRDSNLQEDDEVDLSTVRIITLERDDETCFKSDGKRLEAKPSRRRR